MSTNLTNNSYSAYFYPSLHCKPITNLPQHLICACCGNAVYNSFQTPHGCRLCQLCVDKHLSDHEVRRCPGTTEACKDDSEGDILIKKDSCTPDLASRREVGRLQVTCANNSCKFQTKWKDMENHLAECEYGTVPCSLCGKDVMKIALKSHQERDCEARRETCSKCNKEYIFSERDTVHFNLESGECCDKHTSSCPYCGKGNYNKQNFSSHISKCEEKPNPCRYAHLGCTDRLSKSKMDAHYREKIDEHLYMLDSRVKELGRTMPTSNQTSTSTVHLPSSTTDIDPAFRQQQEDMQIRILNIHDHFKKLQINVANWAHTTMEFESLAHKFGGISQLKSFLKNVEEKVRSIDTGIGTGTTPSVRSANIGSSGSIVDTETQQKLIEISNRLSNIDSRFLNIESTNYEGCIIWKIVDFSKHRREARSKSQISIFSQPFFSKRYGYSYRVRLFPNGDGGVADTYLSVYLIVTKGDYDDILEWPMSAEIVFKLYNLNDSSKSVIKKVKFDCNNRPQTAEDLSVFSGDLKFIKLNQLESDQYMRNDTFYLEVDVETSQRRGKRK